MKRRFHLQTRTKMIWPITLPDDLWRKVREKAVNDATTISAAVTTVIDAVIGDMEESLPEQPQRTQVRLQGARDYKAGQYFLPILLAEKISTLSRRGYSNPYLTVMLVRAGFQKLEEQETRTGANQ